MDIAGETRLQCTTGTQQVIDFFEVQRYSRKNVVYVFAKV